MTSFREAIENAGVTPEGGVPQPSVDDLKKLVDDIAGEEPQASPIGDHPSVVAQRPKLAEESEVTGVAQKIADLMSDSNDVANNGSGATDTSTLDDLQRAIDETDPEADFLSGAAALGTDTSPFDSVPFLNTSDLVDEASGYSKEIREIDSPAPLAEAADDVVGVEVSEFDPLAIESEMAIDPNIPATGNEYEEYELVTIEDEPLVDGTTGDDATSDDQTDDAFGDSTPSETADQSADELPTERPYYSPTDSVFDPNLIPGLKAGQAVSVDTTSDTNVGDPVATASEVAGSYEPQDLADEWDSSQANWGAALGDTPGDTAEDTSGVHEETPQNATEDSEVPAEPMPQTKRFAKIDTVESAVIAAAMAHRESDVPFLETSSIQSAQGPPPPVEIPAENRELPPLPGLPGLPGVPTSSQTSSQVTMPEPLPPAVDLMNRNSTSPFEAKVLANITTEPMSLEYEQMADSIIANSIGAAPSSLCFVSAEDATHATEVVAHLGAYFATKKNKKTLLLDVSTSPDPLTRSLEKDRLPGLWNMSSNEEWADMIVPTSIPNLSLLPTGWKRKGQPDRAPSDFVGLVPRLIGSYDIVLVESGVAERSEDTPFYASCEQTYMVVRLGQTDRNVARAVRNGLLEANVPFGGCIVTNVESSRVPVIES